MKSREPLRRLFVGGIVAALFACGAQAQDGDAVAPGGGRVVRGTVTAVAADHLTVKTDGGDTFQVAVTPNTQVRKGRELVKYSDLHAGDGVGAMGEVDRPYKTVHALYLFVVDAEQLKKAREAMGKTYIAGKITAMNDVKITVLRADGVSQTIIVDEDTSFKRGGRGMSAMMGGGGIGPGTAGGRSGGPTGAGGPAGGESVTLADIKVGDTIAGSGALKNGVFVPTQVFVGDPAATGRRHASGTAGAPAAEPK